ncbi:LOW QUALITY PROTEIN: KH domain-containing, RNA-binding, signal transduction-associated protein 2-like [Sitophilus oryzae]|uniref:LOW QUALITY PROTEIN: KH domain-containing, RNA-binding, signal transduction-associated protein 2-like n=1 Tax=Sitophilus oryzae TaxID=7048 RepID=A0A6J2XSQ0_SITOR|nr:LOW QUALITY PROTEIN: KH domain-containing, RNA-binding, signal transduction-associated protein 2-like [Sitophilus oryzae]
MADGRWTKRLIEWRPRAHKRSQGRPPTRWTDDLKRITTNWIATAKNRENWDVWGRPMFNYGRNKGSSDSRRMVDITRDKPIKVAVRVAVPVRDHPKFNFVGKLLGPKGNSLKRLQEDTMCKMAVLGRGSMRDRHKEEELRASGDPKFQHLSEELHVEISAFATPAEAHARIAYALAEVRRFLVPDYNDDIRQEQMWEMQVLSSQKNKGDDTKQFGSGDEERITIDTGGESGSQSPQDHEHPAMRGVPTGTPASEQLGILSTNGSNQMSSPSLNGSDEMIPQSLMVASAAGRKRPLLTAGPRTAMTPTKRTVMSLLAKARAAQAKQLASPFAGTTTERPPTLVPLLREDYMAGGVNLNLI